MVILLSMVIFERVEYIQLWNLFLKFKNYFIDTVIILKQHLVHANSTGTVKQISWMRNSLGSWCFTGR